MTPQSTNKLSKSTFAALQAFAAVIDSSSQEPRYACERSVLVHRRNATFGACPYPHRLIRAELVRAERFTGDTYQCWLTDEGWIALGRMPRNVDEAIAELGDVVGYDYRGGKVAMVKEARWTGALTAPAAWVLVRKDALNWGSPVAGPPACFDLHLWLAKYTTPEERAAAESAIADYKLRLKQPDSAAQDGV